MGIQLLERFTQFQRFAEIPRLSTAQWFSRSIGDYVCPYVTVPGFNPQLVAFCSMHVSNLGLVQWVNAGVLLALLERGWFGVPTMPLSERLRLATMCCRGTHC